MDKKQVGILLKSIDGLYPNRVKLEPDTVEIWHKALRDQDNDVIVQNLVSYSKENKFPPTIADLMPIKKRGISRSQIEHEEMLRREGLLID